MLSEPDQLLCVMVVEGPTHKNSGDEYKEKRLEKVEQFVSGNDFWIGTRRGKVLLIIII